MQKHKRSRPRQNRGSVAHSNVAGEARPRPETKKQKVASGRTKSTASAAHLRKNRAYGFFMDLPFEVFTEIISHSYPGDLLALARTNKSLRHFLMRQSAAHLWGQAECNLSSRGLPRCPPLMSEPEYAALLFTKNCSICGVSTTSQADLYLYARLCKSCRATELVDVYELTTRIVNLIPRSPIAGPQNDKTELTYYCLRDHARKVDAIRADLKSTGDLAARETWEYEQDVALGAQLKLSMEVYSFLRHWDYDEKAQTMMRERRKTIEQRLVDLDLESSEDWEQIHYSFYVLWNTLTEQPKPLTEGAWKALLPTIQLTLEESRYQNYVAYLNTRQDMCSRRLNELWREVGANPGRLGSIVAALGARSMPSLGTASDGMNRAVLTPFPGIEDGLEWDFMATFCDGEHNVNQTEQLFTSVLDRIQTKIPEWVNRVELDLARLLSKPNGSRTKRQDSSLPLTVKGSTEAAAHLPGVTRRLLRADCAFKASDEHPLYGVLYIGSDYLSPLPLCYPDLLITRRGKAWNPEWFQPYSEACRVAKALLACLGMGNAAHAEMKVMGCRFVCGRCSDRKAWNWDGMVGHYLQEQRRHKYRRFQPPGVSHLNSHSLAETRGKLLVQIAPEEQLGEVIDLASIVPPLKPWKSGRERRTNGEDRYEFKRDGLIPRPVSHPSLSI
ncbi:hypothetical protein FRC12_010659 [Ceratobasidium sp. 428]|nr:hypothetical protein FRC12_010659 [Ceratobasidium sp. 428]